MSGIWRVGLRVEGFPGEGNGRSRSVGEGKGLAWKRTTGEGPRGGQ